MSSKIDERIVGMKFNGDQFQKGVADTNSSLEKLKQGLNLNGATKGLNDLDAASRNFSLAGMAQGVSDIAGKFGALAIVGITALANIANKAVDAGLTIMRSLTIDPIKAGFGEYELKMGSIQTILANTARYGTQLPEVTANLDELNAYADKTIYNFGDMTKNIGLFTNAGIKVGDATSMIKGFSNEAAASGTSAQGAAGAAYQLSQALSAGTVRLMDWRSLQNVGMGNKNMQNGLIEIAGAMGMLNEDTTDAASIQADFNGSLEKNWLSADVMSNYLKIMAGDMDGAAMSAMGLSDAQIQMFMDQQKMSEEAATKVRTFTQLMGTLQESVGSGWAQTFDILIGDFTTATDLWTGVNDTLGAMIGKQAEARNQLLQSFVDAGGRDAIIESISNIWKAVQNVLTPIQSAFKEIFPPMTAGRLLLLVNTFKDFTEALKPSGEQMAQIKRIAMGVFSVFDIGWMIVKNLWGVLTDLFGSLTEGSGDWLEAAANIGDWLTGVRDALKYGGDLTAFFDGLGDVLQKPVEWLRKLGEVTIDFIAVETWAEAWENLGNALRNVGEFFAPAVAWVKKAFAEVKQVVGDFFRDLDPNVLMGSLAAGGAGVGLGAGGLLAKLGIDKLVDFFKGGGPLSGISGTIKEVFGAVTDTFSTMQQKLKAEMLKNIAIAIGIMAAAVILLSFVDTGKLFTSLGAMTIMFGQLSAMLIVMDKFMSDFKGGQLAKLAGTMILLATAMLIMSVPILILGSMEWDELARGLIGMSVGMVALMYAMQTMDGMSKKIMKVVPALILISTAMLILAVAIKIMGSMAWTEVATGLTVFGVALGILVGTMKLLTKATAGIGMMLALAGSLLIISAALKVFGTMSWDEILRSLTVMVVAIGTLAGAMILMSSLGKYVVTGAAVMLAMGVVLNLIVGPMKEFGKMSWEEIGKSIVMLAASLGILAIAMALMGIPVVALGGLALFVVSAGLMMLAPALVLLGGMSWDDIGRGLAMLGASLLILAVGGLLMIPASVGFLLLGAAVLLLGAGAMMAGQGMLMFAAGFIALAGAAALGSEAIKVTLTAIAEMIPTMMTAFAQGLIDFALVIAQGGTEFTMAMTTLIMSMLVAIQTTAPQIIETIWQLIVQLVGKIVAGVPLFVDAGMKIIIGFLNGIGNNIGNVINAGTKVIVEFLNGLARNIPFIIQAGINLVISFIEGVANGIRANTGRFIAAGNQLFRSIVEGVSQAIENGGSLLRWAGARIGNAIIEGAKNALGINSPSKVFRDYIMGSVYEGVEKGEDKGIHRADRSGKAIGDAVVSGAAKALEAMSTISTDMEFEPTIRPIVDLSDVKAKQDSLSTWSSAWGAPTLSVGGSYNYAASIAEARKDDDDPTFYDDEGDEPTGQVINFTQNNYSPKAISAAETYRNTNNQLSVLRKGQAPANAKQS